MEEPSLRMLEDNYEQEVFGTLGGAMVSIMELNELLDYLKPKDNEEILDIGTGTGRIARVLIKHKVDLTGIDLNFARIKTSVKNRLLVGGNASNYKLVVADGQFLPFEDSSFDAIVCIRSLKYFPNYLLGIREMSRVLKPGGRLVLSISNVYGIDSILLRLRLLAYKKLFRFGALKPIFAMNNLKVQDALALNKIHPKVWTFFTNASLLAFLHATELTLKKATPKEFLSRELMLRLVSTKNPRERSAEFRDL